MKLALCCPGLLGYIDLPWMSWNQESIHNKHLRQKKKKKRLFGCPPLPAPNFWKLEKRFYCTKVLLPLIFRIKKKKGFFFFFENFDLLKIFLSCCFQLVYILILVLNLYLDIFGKVDLFAPLLGDTDAIILCSFDFDMEKKNLPARPFSKKVVEDNQSFIYFRPKLRLQPLCPPTQGFKLRPLMPINFMSKFSGVARAFPGWASRPPGGPKWGRK